MRRLTPLLPACLAVLLIAASGVTVAFAQAPKPAAEVAKPEARTAAKKPLTEGQAKARERQKACAAQWKTDKAAGKTGGQTWPGYWSACNRKLKAASA